MYGPMPSGHEKRYTFTVESIGNDQYYLKHLYSGKYLCSGEKTNGGQFLMYGPVPKDHEKRYAFKFRKVGTDKYYVEHIHSGKFLCSGDKKNDGVFWLWGPVPKGHESRYTFILSNSKDKIEAGFKAEDIILNQPQRDIVSVTTRSTSELKGKKVYLKHNWSGKYLCSGDKANGGKFWMYGPVPSGHEDRYTFELESVGKGNYYLKHLYSGKYLCSGEKANGGNISMWGPIPKGHEARYSFMLESLGGSKYYLKHSYSGKYLCSGEKNNKGGFWLWGPIPKGHENKYTFDLVTRESKMQLQKMKKVDMQQFSTVYTKEMLINPSSLVLNPAFVIPTGTDMETDDIGTTVQGPDLLKWNDINTIFGDQSFSYFSEKLNLYKWLYEDKNPNSGFFYYLPANYNLKWNKETGEFSFYIYYLSADEDGRGEVVVSAELTPSISRTDIELAELLLSKKLNKTIRLVPIPLTGSPKISFNNALSYFDVDESTVSTSVPTDFLQPIVVSWKMDRKVDDLVGAMMHSLGITGNIDFKPYTATGGETITVQVKLKVNDPGTYGKMEYSDAPSLLNGFYNSLDYPVLLTDLIILRENATKTHFIDKVSLNNYEVQPTKFSSFSQSEVSEVQSGGLIKKMWLNYSIKPCDTCNTVVQNKILGGTSSSRVNEIEIEVISPLESSGANSIKVLIKSVQGDPNGKSEVILPIVNITEDNKTYSGGELFIGEGEDPDYVYRIYLIKSDGEVVPSDWVEGNDLFIIIGENTISNLLSQEKE